MGWDNFFELCLMELIKRWSTKWIKKINFHCTCSYDSSQWACIAENLKFFSFLVDHPLIISTWYRVSLKRLLQSMNIFLNQWNFEIDDGKEIHVAEHVSGL